MKDERMTDHMLFVDDDETPAADGLKPFTKLSNGDAFDLGFSPWGIHRILAHADQNGHVGVGTTRT